MYAGSHYLSTIRETLYVPPKPSKTGREKKYVDGLRLFHKGEKMYVLSGGFLEEGKNCTSCLSLKVCFCPFCVVTSSSYSPIGEGKKSTLILHGK